VYRYQTWAPTKREEAAEFIAKYSAHHSQALDVWFQFGIYVSDNNQLIGDCGFCLRENHQAEIGYTISPSVQKNGYGIEAVQALINFLTFQFDVLKIVASCDPRNIASISLLKKLGFVQDGFYPKSLEIRGEWVDDVVFVKTYE
jgi:RimJ/RimL family protein N-acetyltransferase